VPAQREQRPEQYRLEGRRPAEHLRGALDGQVRERRADVEVQNRPRRHERMMPDRADG
jgi:hypothetical protein